MTRLVILTEIISPYRIPLFNALAKDPDISLHVIFLSETDPSLRQWQIYKEEMRFSYQILPSWRKRLGKFNVLLNRGSARALSQASPDVILCGGYNYLASWQALLWARSRGIPFLLWSESNLQDARRGHPLVELLKTEFLRRCNGFVVPGRSARRYLLAHRIHNDDIFVAPNAVDNDLFNTEALAARQNEDKCRRDLGLPGRYFLFVGRLVGEKGIFELLAAYTALDTQLRKRIGLVFTGDGTCRRELEQQAASIAPGIIKFTGFVQREQLAKYYALAEMLVLPTYTDTWGLVVNEAMACGLPVIVSRAAGCAEDLVKEGWNGLLVSPRDVAGLSLAMKSLAERAHLSEIGDHSRQKIAAYSAQEWSTSIGKAVRRMAGTRD